MIINKTLVSFAGRTPSPRYVPVGVVGDNLVECVEFRLPTIDADQTATMLLKCKYADAITLTRTDTMTYCADITAQIAGESGKLEAYIRIDGAGGAVWNSEPFMLCVCNVPDISGDVEDREPGALERTLSAIAAHNAAMKQHSEDMEETAEAASESAENAEESAGRAEAAAKRAEEISEPYTLPVATADRLGGVRVGKGLAMDGEALAIADGLTLFDSVEVKEGEIIESFKWDYQNVKEIQIFAFFPKQETDERITGNIGGVGIYMPSLINKLADQYLWIRWEKRENTFPLYGMQASREGYHTSVYTLGMYLNPIHGWPDTPIRFYGRSGGYPVGTKISIYGRME